MSDITSFLCGFSSNRHGKFISDIWKYSKEELESDHTYIQYLFPNREPSHINPLAPLLTDEVIEEVKNSPDLIETMRLSLKLMMRFYQLDTPHVYDEFHIFWWCSKNNHNYLRITRIINALKAFDMQTELDNFYTRLMRVFDNNEAVIGTETAKYWNDAYDGTKLFQIKVLAKVELEREKVIEIRASSLESAKEMALEDAEADLCLDGGNEYWTISKVKIASLKTE